LLKAFTLAVNKGRLFRKLGFLGAQAQPRLEAMISFNGVIPEVTQHQGGGHWGHHTPQTRSYFLPNDHAPNESRLIRRVNTKVIRPSQKGDFSVLAPKSLAPENGASGIDRHLAKLFFDTDQLVVFGQPVRTGKRPGLDLSAVRGHCQIGNGRVLGLA